MGYATRWRMSQRATRRERFEKLEEVDWLFVPPPTCTCCELYPNFEHYEQARSYCVASIWSRHGQDIDGVEYWYQHTLFPDVERVRSGGQRKYKSDVVGSNRHKNKTTSSENIDQ